jgi:CheY-like chemotaxis protein
MSGILLPFGRERGKGAKAAPETGNGHASRGTILVVEDVADTRGLLRFILERSGYRVVEAADGKAADDFIRSQAPPDLVILDLQLPVKDGFELTRQIRETPNWREARVLWLSALNPRLVETRMRELHPDGWMRKPFIPHDLLAKLDEMLAGPRGQQARRVPVGRRQGAIPTELPRHWTILFMSPHER